MPWDSSLLFCIATNVIVLAASWEKLLKIADVDVFSGQGFEVKLNFTDKNALPEEVSFVKLKNTSGQQDIEIIFLYYHKIVGPMSGSVDDSRISFTGDLSSGHVWFRFIDVHVKDSGTYGVLYKRPKNTDIFESVFEVNVTQAPITTRKPKTHSEWNHIYPRERQGSTTTSTKVVNQARESGSASTSRDAGILVLLLAVVTSNLI